MPNSDFFFRNKAPPRPQGQRTEPEAQNPFMNGFGLGGGGEGGFQFHFGVGAFPFGFFALFNNGRLGHGQMPNGKIGKSVYICKTILYQLPKKLYHLAVE